MTEILSPFGHKNNTFNNPYFAAHSLYKVGLSCLPLRLDGSKSPAFSTSHPYLHQRATIEDIEGWFAPRNGLIPKRGIGIVCGPISGNLEAIDFDDASIIRPFEVEVRCQAPELLEKLVWVITPRPGLQLFYRCPAVGRNHILAAKEMPANAYQIQTRQAYRNKNNLLVIRKVLIETRAEGGYCVAVGSPATVHKSGRPYRFYPGKRNYSEIQTITPEERDILFRAAKSFCLMPPPLPRVTVIPARQAGALRAGDDFNARGDVEALLKKHGWTPAGSFPRGSYWRRPGKEEGKSAVLNEDRRFYVFSSNAAPLRPGLAYRPFSLLVALEFNGDGAAAARYLGQLGFGE